MSQLVKNVSERFSMIYDPIIFHGMRYHARNVMWSDEISHMTTILMAFFVLYQLKYGMSLNE